MDELDKILKGLIKSKSPEGNPIQGKECISEERFAEYLDNLLNATQKEVVEKHLNSCDACFEKSILFSKVATEMQNMKQTNVPEELISETKELIRKQSSKDMIEIVLEFGKDIINIIKDTAGVCTVPELAVLSVRNGTQPSKGTAVVKLSREFQGIKADISVEKTGNAECEIEATLSDTSSGELLDDIRVSLISGEKELASYLTVKGSASFKALKFDHYVLEIYKGKDLSGSILLKLSSV